MKAQPKPIKDVYIRRNGRWAKIGGVRGKYHVAKGFQDQPQASYVLTTSNRTHAEVIANNWVDDK